MVELNPRRVGSTDLGVEITSLQARDAGAGDVKALKDVLAQHGVVALRDQQMTSADYVRFAELFGEIEPSTREQYWLPSQPEIYVISNIVENGRPIGNPNDGFVWHTDQYYFERPTAYTFLYALEIPEVGGDTQFCSTRMLYESMDQGEKDKLDAIQIMASHEKLNSIRRNEGKHVEDSEMDKLPDVAHPLVRRHPVSNEHFLYFSAFRASRPINMSDETLDSMLTDLFERSVRPENIYSHKWKIKDLVIWDNRGLLHKATGYDKKSYRRLCHRVSVVGERPYH